MSTGKRLAKRSIIGTRVCAPVNFGHGHELYIPGVISASRGVPPYETIYTVRFSLNRDQKLASLPARCEYRPSELIGPGFGAASDAKLVPGQKVFVTHNGREVAGTLIQTPAPGEHEVFLTIDSTASKDSLSLLSQVNPTQVKRRTDELRLLESRKSARLLDTMDTDYSKLAIGATEQVITSSTASSNNQSDANNMHRGRTSSMSSSISSTSANELPALTK